MKNYIDLYNITTNFATRLTLVWLDIEIKEPTKGGERSPNAVDKFMIAEFCGKAFLKAGHVKMTL